MILPERIRNQVLARVDLTPSERRVLRGQGTIEDHYMGPRGPDGEMRIYSFLREAREVVRGND